MNLSTINTYLQFFKYWWTLWVCCNFNTWTNLLHHICTSDLIIPGTSEDIKYIAFVLMAMNMFNYSLLICLGLAKSFQVVQLYYRRFGCQSYQMVCTNIGKIVGLDLVNANLYIHWCCLHNVATVTVLKDTHHMLAFSPFAMNTCTHNESR